MLKSVLPDLPKSLRHLVWMNGAGDVRIDGPVDGDSIEAIVEYLGSALHHWRSVRGPSLAEREAAIDVIAALIHQADEIRVRMWSRAIEPTVIPAGVSIH